MKYIDTSNGLELLTIHEPPFGEILGGFFTRKGGVSPTPFDSLNLSVSTGDAKHNVVENRDRIFDAIDRPVSSVYDVWQIHSDRVVCTNEPKVDGQDLEKADAIFSSNPDVTLLMRFADCVPILIYDPIKKVVGIIHAGWQGTINQIARKSVETITHRYGCVPGDIHAVIGPSIGPEQYEVRENVYLFANNLFPENDKIILQKNGKKFLNLWEANEELLKRSGVRHITQTHVCTACDTGRWYSHRAEAGKTGRFAAVICLK